MDKTDQELKAALALLQEQLAQLLGPPQQAKEPAKPARLARGSAPPKEPMTLDKLLQEHPPMSRPQLAKILDVSEQQVDELTKALEDKGAVINLGPALEPRWTWKAGEGASPEELTDHVVRLISDRPMTWRELLYATGASHARLSGALERARKEYGAENVRPDTPRKAVWFISKK